MTVPPELLERRPPQWKSIGALFTDLDDTLTMDGLLPSPVLDALERLRAEGVRVAVATGRSAGWADALIHLLPLDAVVYETGGGTVERRQGRLVVTESKAAGKLAPLAKRFLKAFPDLHPAMDQPFRRTDFAVDIAENRRVPKRRVEEALQWLRKQPGVTALASSVHINFWYGSHSKATGCTALLRRWKIASTNAVVCGDAPNDESMFEKFPESVGVANIAPRLAELVHAPRYRLARPASLGFCDLARLILAR